MAGPIILLVCAWFAPDPVMSIIMTAIAAGWLVERWDQKHHA